MAARHAGSLARVGLQDSCKSCMIVATSLAVCKIFEAIWKIFLQDVSKFAASLPAGFLQDVYVWVLTLPTFRIAFLHMAHNSH